MELKGSSLKALRNLSALGFHDGEGAFNNILRRYAKMGRAGRLPGDPSYISTVSLFADPNLKEPQVINITKVVVYPHEREDKHALSAITIEWAHRTIQQQVAIRNSYQDYLGWRTRTPFWRRIILLLFSHPTTTIMDALTRLTIEEGLNFLAVMAAQWSYRFNQTGYLQFFRGKGWPMLDSLHINDFIAQTAIMFIAMGWQVEHIVPVYWQLLQKGRKAS